MLCYDCRPKFLNYWNIQFKELVAHLFWCIIYASGGQVGGYVVEYQGVVLATVRGAGHKVPSYQPGRALSMIASFLQGTLPPPS